MRAAIGLSRDPDPGRAATQAVRQAKKSLPRPDLALVFGSIHYDQRKLHRALCRELDPQILLGGSSYAEITTAGVTKGSVAVLLLSLEDSALSFATAETGSDPYETGKALAGSLSSPAGGGERMPVGLLFTAFVTGYENEMLRGLGKTLDRVPVFGGMTCGDYDLGMSHPDFWKNYQYAGPRLARKAARLALLDLPVAKFRLGFGFEHGWEPVGPPVELTRCLDNKVYEVDGLPVFDYYRQFIGKEAPDAFFELMIQRFGFSLLVGDGHSVLKLPVASDFKEGCIAYFPAEDLQGRKVRLIQASRRGLLEGARRAAQACQAALDGAPPSLVLVVSCRTRNAILHSRMETEVQAIQEVFGKEVPLFGCYSGGEIVPFLNRYEDITSLSQRLSGSHYHTTTVGLLALASLPKARVSVPRKASPAIRENGPAEVARLKELLSKSEEVLDTTESFLANLSRKSYRDSEQLRKQNEVIHRYTPHEVWNRVGASVARGEYEVPDSEFNGCFFFMDVKGFTSFSEEHPPAQVVSRLNEIFEPATRIIYERGGDVDKFIGDCIFAAFRDPEEAVEAARRILKLFEGLKAQGNPFTVRIGIHSGRAVRANVGSKDRREYTYIGDAVNLAQRLESNCTPGRMLLSEDLYRLLKTPPPAERREIQAKGKKAPVPAYECAP